MDEKLAAAVSPDPVDVHVGRRIRLRRKMRGVSQEQLAHALSVSFQQVQKYERGANRISASKLYLAAQFLDAPVAFFFEGLPTGAGDHAEVVELAGPDDSVALARSFPRIESRGQRRAILDLVRTLASRH